MRRIAGAVALLLVTGACSSNVPVISSGERYAAAQRGENYRVDTGDRLRLTIYNEPQLSGEFSITPAGTLSYPLIGDIPARGLTLGEISQQLLTRLANGYLRDPRVAVEIAEYRPVYILGEVSRSGKFPYEIGMTALTAVATAGGFTPRSDQKVIYIQREGETEETAYALTPALKVFPGDTVRIAERYF